MGSSDKKHILDSILSELVKRKTIAVQEYLMSGQMGCEEKKERKTFGEIMRWGKILPAVPMMFSQCVEVCTFTYCLPQQHSLATQEKSSLEACSSSLRKLHQSNQSRVIIRSGTAMHLFLPGHAFPFLGALFQQMSDNISLSVFL